MYAVHLRGWLQLYRPTQLRVIDPAKLFSASEATRAASMRQLLGVGQLDIDETSARDDVLREVSPGARELGHSDGPHENAKRYVVPRAKLPTEISHRLSAWLQPQNCDLALLLSRHGLGGNSLEDMPWLVADVCTEDRTLTCAWACTTPITEVGG